MKKLLTFVSILFLGIMLSSNIYSAGKPPLLSPTGTAFTFSYNVGTTVTNYHAYGMACQIVFVTTQPSGTIILGEWYVWDLGKVTGTGTVVCPHLITPRGFPESEPGILFFADARDTGGDGTQIFTHPIADVQIFNKKYYNGYASIEMIEPPLFPELDPSYTGLQIYWGPPFTPFYWDLSPYINN